MLSVIGLSIAGFALLAFLWPKIFSSKPPYNFKGKHVILSGASQGMGRAVAIELAKKGAHVSLIARNEALLSAVVEAAKAVSQSSDQKIGYYKCDVTKKEQVRDVVRKISKEVGPPNCIFPCAGCAVPKYFLDASLEDFENQMQLNYFGSLYLIHEGLQVMKEEKVKGGRVVFVTSTMALTAFAGYSPYAPTKWALRCLFDSLSSEAKIYGIETHMIYPPSMDTPGFKQENLVKPEFTKQIENSSELFTPEKVAQISIQGIEKGKHHITIDLGTELLRILGGGSSQRENLILESAALPLLAGVASGLMTYLTYLTTKIKTKKE